MLSQGKSFSGYENNALFLNLEGHGFAETGGLLGADLQDDSRAVAVADWDRDGDLDLWLTARTAPQVRLLRNNQPQGNSFVAFRLLGNGTTTNRAAVGARLTLWQSSQPKSQQIRTIHAGDGFLSQSSAWVHFGLGKATENLLLSVAWPGGATETFSGLKAGGRYVITQREEHSEVALSISTGPDRVSADRGPEPDDAAGGGGFWIANRVPFPQLTYTDAAGASHSTTDQLGQPLFVTLWATWCAPCLQELGELGGQAETVRASGVNVLALNVDGLAVKGSGVPSADSEEVLARVGYGLARGFPRQEDLGMIEVLIEFLSSRRTPLSIPSSFLVDAEGKVAAVYLETVEWNRLSADLAVLDAPEETQLQRLSPRPGRWFGDPRQVDEAAHLSDYATLFAKNGFPGESQRLYAILEAQGGVRSAQDFYNQAKAAAEQGRTEQAMEDYRAAIRLQPDYGPALTGLGALLLLQKRLEEAEDLFKRALSIDPNHATALINLAMIDQARGDKESALGRLQSVVARNPEYAEAHLNLGSLLASMQEYEEAIQHFSKAVALNPKSEVAHLNLAAAYMQVRDWEQAADHYESVLESNPRMAYPHYGLGVSLARRDRHGEAVTAFRKAIALGGANAPTYTELSLSLQALGEEQAAEEALQVARKLDSARPEAPPVQRERGSGE